MNSLLLRQARTTDAAAITAIYNQGIVERCATFETEPRQVGDLLPRLADQRQFPWWVATDTNDALLGWANLSSYRPRACYAGIAEFSIYLDREARGQGVGRQLLPALMDAAQRHGYWKLVSRIFTFNASSRALCKACGFREVGIYEKHGQLDGQWLDVVTRQHRDRMKHAQRNEAPFVVRYLENGTERDLLARAVIDASGTADSPNPLGASGIAALGERRQWENIFYGLPDVLGTLRSRYQGKRVLVVGSGHSAFNVLTDLATLNETHPGGSIHWAVRRPSLQRVLGGGENDQLKERGRLGLRMAALAEAGELQVHASVSIDRIERGMDGLVAWSGDRALPPVDEIVGATGFRPDLTMLSEVRLDLDPATESPAALAPLIDPNLHSCGTVRPHGAEELKHPDAGLYIVGMKSYGRAPTFLMLTGYEQVRSVVAAIAGDWEAARRVELVLPETGVCSTQFADEDEALTGGCCGGPAPAPADACCVADVEAKTAGKSGCGCATPPRQTVASA